MKSLIQITLLIFAVASIATGNYMNAIFAFGMSATLNPIGMSYVAVFPCELGALGEPDDCGLKSGLSSAYWAKYSEIDWAAMVADADLFTPATHIIKEYAMVGAAVFKKIDFNRKGGNYSFTWTEESQAYAQLIPFIFEGKSNANRLALTKAISCCKIVLHLFDNNGLERVVGVEYNGTVFNPQVTNLKIVRHLDASGSIGGDKSRDEIDLGGESTYTPLFATVTEALIPV